jgi:hypothetical protein
MKIMQGILRMKGRPASWSTEVEKKKKKVKLVVGNVDM